MNKKQRAELERFWQNQSKQARSELSRQGENDHLDGYRLVEFVSSSAGRGKKRSRLKEIMLVVSGSGKVYSVKPDVPHNGLDTTAELAAGSEYRDGLSAWEWFIQRLRNRGN